MNSVNESVSSLSELLANCNVEIQKLIDQKNKVENMVNDLKKLADQDNGKKIKKKDKLQEEIRVLKKEKEELQKELLFIEEIVSLNIGGVIYTTTKNTLQKHKGTMLDSMFSGRHNLTKDSSGNYFLDRDGKSFRYILNYLRNGYLTDLPRKELIEIRAEAEFFSIPFLIREIDERLKDMSIGQFAVLRYNENSSSNNLSWQGKTEPCPLTFGKTMVYKCIDEVLTEADNEGWQLTSMSGDGSAEGGWMYVFRKKPSPPYVLKHENEGDHKEFGSQSDFS
eukprot:TRINITY_DN4883_c0_g1_i1.p1 TRINITY_DN4883_c0_g1~~TRINITY_DN4883_c0_g1_i1.p1  ORF type:complete len:280 (-),score=51.94 TRINITY_DN4883_c0_g1_i1:58-897(-)